MASDDEEGSHDGLTLLKHVEPHNSRLSTTARARKLQSEDHAQVCSADAVNVTDASATPDSLKVMDRSLMNPL